jgi:hypothetical protein
MSSLLNTARNLRVPRFAEDAVERARLVVVPRQRRGTAPRVPFVMLVGLVLLAGVAGLLMFNTHMQQTSFLLTARQSRADALHAQEQQLRLALDKLRDPQTLAERAVGMGMRPADSPSFLDLRSGRIIGGSTASTGVNDFAIDPPRASKPSVLKPDPVILPRQVIEKPAKGASASTSTNTRANHNSHTSNGAAGSGTGSDAGRKKHHD